jgi:hypothetical protein
MKLPSTDQVTAGLRHVGTAAATTGTIFVVLGLVPQDQLAGLLNGLHETTDGLSKAFGGFSKVIAIIGPLAIVWFGRAAMVAQSLKHQLTSVATSPDVKIEGKILAPAAIANAVPSDKVVPHVDDALVAKPNG